MKKIISIQIVIILVFVSLATGASQAPQKVFNSSLNQDNYDMVIISPDEFTSIIQPLVNHKINFGLQTFIKKTEDIYNNYQGRDKQEKIKYFIKNAIETYQIEYVLLIGDIYKLPIRKVESNWWYGSEVFVDDIITDLYYADIYDSTIENFSSWDTNNDNIFGEFYWKMKENTIKHIDLVDLYPDICIGRIPCSNNQELQQVINKIISYESSNNSDPWFKRLLLLGGDTFPYSQWPTFPETKVIEGEVVLSSIENIMTDFKSIRLWASENNFSPIKINKEWTQGAGFVSYSGHGFPYGFATAKPNSTESITYNFFNLLMMRNNEKLPIVFLDACLTAKLDFQIFGYHLPCFAWALLKKSNGGSIVTIGSTREAWEGYFNPYGSAGIPFINKQFFKEFNNHSTVGKMLTNAQIHYLNTHDWKDCLTVEEIILLGDPSLKIGGYN